MNSSFSITTLSELRASFWESNPQLVCRKTDRGRIMNHNEQPCDTRCAFVDYIDALEKDRAISSTLAARATIA